MRDIVPADFRKNTLPKTDYRSYKDFPDSYKDDQESVSSTDSGVCEKFEPKTGSFRNYLESYNHKKFSSVKPLPPKVKSEIHIQVGEVSSSSTSGVSSPTPSCGSDEHDSAPPLPVSLPPAYPPIPVTMLPCDVIPEPLQTLDVSPVALIQPPGAFAYIPPPPTSFLAPVGPSQPPEIPPPPPLCLQAPAPPPLPSSCPPPPPPPPMNFPKGECKKWAAVEVEGYSTPSTCDRPANPAMADLARVLTQHLQDRRRKVDESIKEAEKNGNNERFNGCQQTSKDEEVKEVKLNGCQKEEGVNTMCQKVPKPPVEVKLPHQNLDILSHPILKKTLEVRKPPLSPKKEEERKMFTAPIKSALSRTSSCNESNSKMEERNISSSKCTENNSGDEKTAPQTFRKDLSRTSSYTRPKSPTNQPATLCKPPGKTFQTSVNIKPPQMPPKSVSSLKDEERKSFSSNQNFHTSISISSSCNLPKPTQMPPRRPSSPNKEKKTVQDLKMAFSSPQAPRKFERKISIPEMFQNGTPPPRKTFTPDMPRKNTIKSSNNEEARPLIIKSSLTRTSSYNGPNPKDEDLKTVPPLPPNFLATLSKASARKEASGFISSTLPRSSSNTKSSVSWTPSYSPQAPEDFSTATVVPVADSSAKVNKNDPNVKKLVYNTYRGLLGAYNNRANDMMATLPRSMVREDRGVTRQLESIAQAAPPPPLGPAGSIPAARPKSEIPRSIEPPLVVQNAMLTKDKKPFTYTPGGIDLSEIRSPRMARRLERNAMNEGVGPVPQQNPYQTGPLPPSALAAMQPQLSVQVFPDGKIPQLGGGAPPPPPPPSGVPPPPPKAPPMRAVSPVPLDVFERPDMTKIIPDNPMAMLRKTSGPVIKRDPIFNRDNYGGAVQKPQEDYAPPSPRPQVDYAPASPRPQVDYAPASPRPQVDYAPPSPRPQVDYGPPSPRPQPEPPRQQAPRQPDSPKTTSGVGAIYVPPLNLNNVPRQPLTPPSSHSESSPVNYAPPPYYKRQPSTPSEPQSPQSPVQRQPSQREPQTPDTPKPPLNKAATPWMAQKRPQQETPEWVNDEPKAQARTWQAQQAPQPHQSPQPQPQQQAPWRVQNQQPPPQAAPPAPQTPPWQQKQQKQSDMQPWQHRPAPETWQQQPQSPPWQQQPQSPPWQQQAQPPPVQPQGGVRKQVSPRDRPQEYGPADRVEVVVVNDPPQVFQHPGSRVVRAPPNHQNNVRVIPVQRDGATNGHSQRVLQKITNTDGDDDEDAPVTEHGPRMQQNFPQRQISTEQVRRMKQESDQELMNKFKQEFDLDDYDEYPRYRGGHIPSKLFWMLDASGVNQDSSLHNEVDPRYRGPHIPSKAFRLLQNMTGGSEQDTVPQNQQNNRGPVVRTIPIQIEGDGPAKTYVPPSEQTAPEPKKYMGSAIPSRSFKILQAMTAPDDCANPVQACENNENYPNDPSSYMQWGFDPNYPPYYYDPYWGYYPNYPMPNFTPSNSKKTRPQSWGFFPGYEPPSEGSDSETNKKKTASTRSTPVPWAGEDGKKARCTPTPVPFFPYYYGYYEDGKEGEEEGANEEHKYQYPPYWDPYYYSYYYGAPPPPMYPPVYSPYSFYPPQDGEEVSDYSSNDEMAYLGAKFAQSNSNPRNAAPTPSLPKQLTEEITQTGPKIEEKKEKKEKQEVKLPQKDKIDRFADDSSVAETSDEDEMVGYEVCRKPPGGLQAIRSVSDIKVYEAEESSVCSEEEASDSSDENDEPSVCGVDETIPHQLSVIFEESERTDSTSRQARENSVASEGTATLENSEDEVEEDNEESDGMVLVKLPLTIKFDDAETTLIVGNSEVKTQTTNSKPVKVKNIAREVSSDSFQTAESESETFYTQSSNASIETTKNVGNGNEDEDIDWWDRIGKDDDLSAKKINDNETKEAKNEKEDLSVQKEGCDDAEKGVWSTDKANQYYDTALGNNTQQTTASTFQNKTSNDLKVQKGMEKVEAVLTNIISTINNRTSPINRSTPIQKKSQEEDVDFWTEIMQPSDAVRKEASSASSSDSSLSSSSGEPKTDEPTDQDVKPLSVQERIKALHEAASGRRSSHQDEETEIRISIKERISAFEDQDKTLCRRRSFSRKSSVKSYEEFSEEEGDSGVTSDISRHISETEEPEFDLKRLTKYQRASTHSRLFKLLQDECDNEDVPEDSPPVPNVEMKARRDHLNLPLKNCSEPESFSSSGFTSPGSPTINDKLVNDLIQSLLRKKQGKMFKHMTMEKIQAAALRILQEDMDGLETLSSSEDGGSFLSPKKPGTGSSTPAQTPQEFYANLDYSQYYDTWAEASRLYDSPEILPSKAFRLVQEHTALNKTGAIAGLLARCPRVLSNKNVQKELMKLMEGEGLSPSPEPPLPPDTSEASAS